MRIVTPQEVTPTILTATNVVNIEPDWAAGTYNEGDRVVYENLVYQAVATTTDQPDVGAVADPPTWVFLGWSNQYRMFRDGADSRSTGTGDIDVTITYPNSISTLAALGLTGTQAQLVITDGTDDVVYDHTIEFVDIGVLDWWEFFFLPYDAVGDVVFEGLPPYPGAAVNLIVSSGIADPVAVGRVVAGVERPIGVTLYGTDVQIQDYSVKERDGFGNLTLVPRRTLKIVNYDVHVPTQRVDIVVKLLSRLAAEPTLFIGEVERTSTVVFGVYTDVSQGITTPSISDLTIQVEEF
jgi:hypothetical protein